MDTTKDKKDRKPSDEITPVSDETPNNVIDSRKPSSEALEPAQNKLNRFLTENNILIGTDRAKVSFTDSGVILIDPPRVFAVYKNQIAKDASKEVN